MDEAKAEVEVLTHQILKVEADDMITNNTHLTSNQSLISPTLSATATTSVVITSLNALQTFILTEEIIQMYFIFPT